MATHARRRRTREEPETSPFPKITNDEGVEVIPVVRHMRPVVLDKAKADELGQSYTEPVRGEDQGKVRVMLTNTNVRYLWNELSDEDKATLTDPEHASGKGPLVRLDVVPA